MPPQQARSKGESRWMASDGIRPRAHSPRHLTLKLETLSSSHSEMPVGATRRKLEFASPILSELPLAVGVAHRYAFGLLDVLVLDG